MTFKGFWLAPGTQILWDPTHTHIDGIWHARVRVQGTHTCTSAVPPSTNQHFTTTDSNNRDEATFQASRLLYRRSRKQIPCIVTTSRDLIPMSTAIVIVRKQNICFLPCKEDKLLHPCKMSKSGHNTCKHYRMSLSFSLCHIQTFMSASKHFLRTPAINAWRLQWKQDNWVTMTYLRHVSIVIARDG